MQLFESLSRLLSRFRYPVSLPEDVAKDLGLHLPNTLTFHVFIQMLSSPQARPTKLYKFMPRQQAEQAFQSALKKESFKTSSFFSYFFNKGWLVLTLHFDEQSRLRRLYIQCPACEPIDGFEIPLEELSLASTTQERE